MVVLIIWPVPSRAIFITPNIIETVQRKEKVEFLFEIEMEMIVVEAIGIGAEHGGERAACALMAASVPGKSPRSTSRAIKASATACKFSRLCHARVVRLRTFTESRLARPSL